MKTKKEHNEYCAFKGVDPRMCNDTNQWMDEPVKEGGGCAHRNQRHGSIDCLRWGLSAKNPREAINRYLACQIHREADRITDRCGSKSLYKSNQTLIPLADPSRLPLIRIAQELWRGRRERLKI